MQRLRRWVGEYPVVAVTIWSGACLLVFVAFILLFQNNALSLGDWLFLGEIIATPLVVAAGTCLVGCVVGQAGCKISRLGWALLWTPLVPLPVMVLLLNSGGEIRLFDAIMISPALTAYVWVGQLLGWSAAWGIVALRRRRATWEHTVPVGVYANERSLGQWSAAHPLLAATLAALGCTFAKYAFSVLLMLLSYIAPLGLLSDMVAPLLAIVLATLVFLIARATARAGRRAAWVLASVAIVAAVIGLVTAILYLTEWGENPTWKEVRREIKVDVLTVAGCVLVGWAAAAVAARVRKSRAGANRE